MSVSLSELTATESTTTDAEIRFEKLTNVQQIPDKIIESDNLLVAVVLNDGTKRPIHPTLSKHDTCTSVEAINAYSEFLSGDRSCQIADDSEIRGFGLGVQLDGTPFAVVDGDAVISDDEMDAGFAQTINRLDSWTERSVSGTGAHVWLKNELPDGCQQKYGDVLDRSEADAEFYDGSKSQQFIFLTGDVWHERSVRSRADRLCEIVDSFNDLTESTPDSVKPAESDPIEVEVDPDSESPSPSTLKNTIEYWAQEKNDDSAQRTIRIWNDSVPTDDESRLDAEFVMRLLYWSKGASVQDILAYWQTSHRSTGEERHSKINGMSYAEYTVRSAIKEWDGSTLDRPHIEYEGWKE